MLNVHQSNRLEVLAGQLAAVTQIPLAAALSPEIVVVQSQGVARWLALQLARLNGVCANVRFTFPAGFAWTLYRALGDLPQTSPFEPEAMAWRIMQLLPAMEGRAEFAPVDSYIRGEVFRRYELARRLAQSYDEYLIYRPDWIAQWEAGDTPHWQAALWRGLVEHADAPHRARLHRTLLSRIDRAVIARAGVTERISVFGAPALPPRARTEEQGPSARLTAAFVECLSRAPEGCGAGPSGPTGGSGPCARMASLTRRGSAYIRRVLPAPGTSD